MQKCFYLRVMRPKDYQLPKYFSIFRSEISDESSISPSFRFELCKLSTQGVTRIDMTDLGTFL